MSRPACIHLAVDNRTCNHEGRPFGRWPVDVECARCILYDGPPRPVQLRIPTPAQAQAAEEAAFAAGVTGGCGPCAQAAARKQSSTTKQEIP